MSTPRKGSGDRDLNSYVPLPKGSGDRDLNNYEALPKVSGDGHLRDWSGLLPDLVLEIAGRLQFTEDFMALRGVCTNWRGSVPKFAAAKLGVGFPLLMLAEKEDSDEREFYSLYKRTVFMKVSLPEAKGRRCLEARFGWLLTMVDSGEVSLLNPISRAQIPLPNFTNFPNYSMVRTFPRHGLITRALLSSNPSNDPSNFVLVIIAKYILGFWRPGDENWTTVGSFTPPRRSSFSNVTYYKDKFYAIDWCGCFWAVDPYRIDDKQPASRIITTLDERVGRGRTLYLVESSDGDLMIVARDDKRYVWGDMLIDVIHINEVTGEWKITSGLDKDAVFIGCNAAISVRVPANDAIKHNHIYFTDDCYEKYLAEKTDDRRGGIHMGVYSIEDGTVEHFKNVESYSFMTPPLWVDCSIIFKDRSSRWADCSIIFSRVN